MSRLTKHRVKQENAASSSSNSRPPEEHDLAYFIHDRVELMHQVFSVLKSKELKSLAPECVRRLSTDDLQELCLEELLGISSKRLCAILDGAEPPSDTESSSQSPEHLETISLDSISSDEEILSTGSSKKKKHKHRHGKRKRKKRKDSEEAGDTRASRAGLTVLELLELQARARAIRAQLHQEPPKAPTEPVPEHSSDNEVEIKEEPAEVVEISSEEEKPDVARLRQQIETASNSTETSNANKPNEESQTVTRRINNLVITVPQSKPNRKIKLKRQKPTEVVGEAKAKAKDVKNNEANPEVTKNVEREDVKVVEVKDKGKKNKKKRKKVKDKGSDEDEITLQLSDTEKMDLLEDLDAKNFDNVSSSDSDSSDDSNDQNVDTGQPNNKNRKSDGHMKTQKSSDNTGKIDVSTRTLHDTVKTDEGKDIEMDDLNKNIDKEIAIEITDGNGEKKTEESNKVTKIKGYVSNDNNDDDVTELRDNVTNKKDDGSNVDAQSVNGNKYYVGDTKDSSKDEGETVAKEQKSDGEISDQESSEVEASDVQPIVVCISDDESKKKKKKKKEKKSKKEKKNFHDGNDNNLTKDNIEVPNVLEMTIDDNDDVYEILEISDDSSCYEVEGVSVLSKEPTAEEIKAFSAKMDEIEIDNDRVIPEKKKEETASETCDAENVSWKDRYLGSNRVKKVLTTSNILNAIRKKNIELKKKIEEAKKAENIEKEKEEKESTVADDVPTVEDGSIKQYETLQGSTRYVDPVKEKTIETERDGETAKEGEEDTNDLVTKEMKKDAKMLLKMYKRLLKYNDITKKRDPSKKKKKKQKKSKDKEKVKV